MAAFWLTVNHKNALFLGYLKMITLFDELMVNGIEIETYHAWKEPDTIANTLASRNTQ